MYRVNYSDGMYYMDELVVHSENEHYYRSDDNKLYAKDTIFINKNEKIMQEIVDRLNKYKNELVFIVAVVGATHVVISVTGATAVSMGMPIFPTAEKAMIMADMMNSGIINAKDVAFQ